MKERKRLTALLCALSLLVGATAFSVAAQVSPPVYLLAVNDKMADLPGGVRPLSVNGVIYVPYTAFDRTATGADLGVYYGLDRTQGTILTLYSMDRMLVFRVYEGVCEDGQGNRMNFRHIRRYGIIYVPAAAVCAFFDLTYSFWPTMDRGTLIRITNGSSTMTDAVFLDLARQRMLERYNSIVQSAAPPATPAPTPSKPVMPPISTPGAREKVPVYLALDMTESEGEDWDAYPDGVPLLVLFPVDALAAHAAQVRRVVARGHSVGLIAKSSRPEEVLAQLERGNHLLSHIARIRTRIAVVPDELVRKATQSGWICWRSNVSGKTAAAVLANLEGQRTVARLTLPPASGRAALRISQDSRYNVCRPLETDLG